MPYWCCAQLQPQRTALALHFLSEVEGFTVYYPRLREQRRSYGRKIAVQPGLFPNYAFVWIELGWWRARWSPGVVRIILDGGVPARVADDVIAEIKAREVHGLV